MEMLESLISTVVYFTQYCIAVAQCMNDTENCAVYIEGVSEEI